MSFDSSIVRILSVLLVMLLIGSVRYGIGYARLRRSESLDKASKSALMKGAQKTSLIGAFLYMVAMVSVAGLFI